MRSFVVTAESGPYSETLGLSTMLSICEESLNSTLFSFSSSAGTYLEQCFKYVDIPDKGFDVEKLMQPHEFYTFRQGF